MRLTTWGCFLQLLLLLVLVWLDHDCGRGDKPRKGITLIRVLTQIDTPLIAAGKQHFTCSTSDSKSDNRRVTAPWR